VLLLVLRIQLMRLLLLTRPGVVHEVVDLPQHI